MQGILYQPLLPKARGNIPAKTFVITLHHCSVSMDGDANETFKIAISSLQNFVGWPGAKCSNVTPELFSCRTVHVSQEHRIKEQFWLHSCNCMENFVWKENSNRNFLNLFWLSTCKLSSMTSGSSLKPYNALSHLCKSRSEFWGWSPFPPRVEKAFTAPWGTLWSKTIPTASSQAAATDILPRPMRSVILSTVWDGS